MRRYRVLLWFFFGCVAAAAPAAVLAAGAGASLSDLLDAIFARTGSMIVVPPGSPDPAGVDLEGIDAREAARRTAAALGGLEPLAVPRPETPALPGTPQEKIYLVPPGNRTRQLLTALGSEEDFLFRGALVEEITAPGPAALPALLDYIDTAPPTPQALTGPVKVLGLLGTPDAVAPLAGILAGARDPLVREAAALSLSYTGSSEAVTPLREALKDPSPGVALRAAYALLSLGDPAGTGLAEEYLDDPRPGVVLRALEVISLTGDGKYVPLLEERIGRSSGFAREKMRETVAELTVGSLGAEEGAAHCATLLADPDPDMRRWAARTLLEMRTPAAENALRSADDDSHPGAAEARRALILLPASAD